MNNKSTGKLGEDLATRFLEQSGYQVLARNYHTRYGELDIICRQNQSLVFVEVKARRNIRFGYPEEAITPRKIQHLKKAAWHYLEEKQTAYREIRFDVITILLDDNNKGKINHIKYAF